MKDTGNHERAAVGTPFGVEANSALLHPPSPVSIPDSPSGEEAVPRNVARVEVNGEMSRLDHIKLGVGPAPALSPTVPHLAENVVGEVGLPEVGRETETNSSRYSMLTQAGTEKQGKLPAVRQHAVSRRPTGPYRASTKWNPPRREEVSPSITW